MLSSRPFSIVYLRFGSSMQRRAERMCICRRHTWMRGTPVRRPVPSSDGNASLCSACWSARVIIRLVGSIRSRLGGHDESGAAGRFNARIGVGYAAAATAMSLCCERGLRYVLPPSERMPASSGPVPGLRVVGAVDVQRKCCAEAGIRELACGSQAFIATLLFDPSMSALPIIVKQNSQSVGLFTH